MAIKLPMLISEPCPFNCSTILDNNSNGSNNNHSYKTTAAWISYPAGSYLQHFLLQLHFTVNIKTTAGSRPIRMIPSSDSESNTAR